MPDDNQPDEKPQLPGLIPIPTEPLFRETVKKQTGRQRGTDDSFTGRAAQLAVVAELLRRKCNAAIPEVDLGTDVFAFRDDRPEVARVQVKACTTPHPYAVGVGYSAKFTLPLKQFERQDDQPPLYYALAVLRDDKWNDVLVVSRARLQSHMEGPKKFGYSNPTSKELELTIEFRERVTCSGRDLTDCRNAWDSLPPLRSLPELEPSPPATASGNATGSDQT